MRPLHKSFMVIICAVIAGVIMYGVFIRPLQKQYEKQHVSIHGLYLIHPLPITQVALTDHNGKPFTLDNLRGHWNLLFFGFTQCEMVCPVTLSALKQFYESIEKKLPASEIPQVVFITIDPKRDTAPVLKKYLAGFNHHFIGARTSPEKTQALKNQFHIIAEKTESRPGQYTHSSEILLVNPEGQIEAYFYFPQNPVELQKDYGNIIRKRTD